MPLYDLVLVHAPSVYDFRRRGGLYGPVADLIPSTPVFEMYPIGFTTIASLLNGEGYRVRILNLASHMLADGRFDAERALRKIRARVFGIDLHWLPHAHGSLEIAKLIRRTHPGSRIVMGGFSATYYHDQILRGHGQVDAVFLGDSAELPMLEYMKAMDSGRPMDHVPNLAFRDDHGAVKSNGITHIVSDLDEVGFDYGFMVRSAIRSLDLTGHLPYLDWKRNPMLLVSTVRGCSHGCLTCMGSCGSFQRNFGRAKPAFRSPEKVIEDIAQIESYFTGAIFILGDIQQPGSGYAERLLSLLREQRPRSEIAFEFFSPPAGGLIDMISGSVERYNVQISPDSHDPGVRGAIGRGYSNMSLESSISRFLKSGANRVDLFFMIGLPGQDAESVLQTVEYSSRLMKEMGVRERLMPFISPLAPFIDPGSCAFEEPDKHGYRLFARTLEEHRKLLTMPSWKHVLNYETSWLTREQIVDSTYSAGLKLNDAKEAVGAISGESASAVRGRTKLAWEAVRKIDLAMQSADPEEALGSIGEEIGDLSESTVCNKRELDWTKRSIYWSMPRALIAAIQGK
ncbi:MAG TPA: TIGR04190 family B12-binding domain/radical SAM domain protein [Euryarchaeota archaeon]|nr:TIGR04190 family B12-binding domain/radical SAM domain protein [Euryarchaeota archaeon]